MPDTLQTGKTYALNGKNEGELLQNPPYPLHLLSLICRSNSEVRGNINAYVSNIAQQGYELNDRYKLESESTKKLISLQYHAETGKVLTDKEYLIIKKDLELKREKDKLEVELFLKRVTDKDGFQGLLKETFKQKESFGNGYWDIWKNDAKQVYKITCLKSVNIRIQPNVEYIKTEKTINSGIDETKTVDDLQNFNVFKDIKYNIFYKEFGDPRYIMQKTGDIYETEEDYNKAIESEKIKDEDLLATEILHFKLESIDDTEYGVPRYEPAITESLTYIYHANGDLEDLQTNKMPNYWINLSGGSLTKDSKNEFKKFFKRLRTGSIKGKEPIITESKTSGGSDGKGVKIDINPLQVKRDDYFVKALKNIKESIRSCFRLSKLFTGDTDGINRATAYAALETAENQVFKPERNDFNVTMTWFLDTVIGTTMVNFYLLGVRLRDSAFIEEIVKLLDSGAITPNEARAELSEYFKVPLDEVNDLWGWISAKYAQLGLLPTEKMNELDIKEIEQINELVNNVNREKE